MKNRLPPEVIRERVRQLYDQSIIATIGSLAAVTIIAALFLGAVDSGILFTWSCLAAGITILRYIVVVRFRHLNAQTFPAGTWERRFVLLVLASGIIWGSTGFFLFLPDRHGLQMILYFVLTAMAAGAAETFSAVPAAFFGYTVPTLLPITIRSIFIGDHIHSILGYGTLIFLLAISLFSIRFYKKTIELIQLKFENTDLVKKLSSEKERIEQMNKNLKEEVLERKKTEAVLAEHKKNLEKIIAGRTMELKEANIGLKKEIEERMLAEKALKKSEEKYRLLVEKANDAICILQDGKVKFHNRKAEELFGYDAEELASKPYMEIIHADDLNTAKQIYMETKTRGVMPEALSLSLVRKDGERKWVHINGIAHTWEGRPAMLCIIRDITRQRHLERQLIQAQKMEAIGELASGIAHDINNILAGIEANVSLLLAAKSKDDPDFRKLADIETYIKSGTGLTRQILGISRPGEKNGSEETRPMNITAVVDETARMFSRTHKNIRVVPEYETDAPLVDMNAGQIQQVFLNLMVNASHAMPDGGTIYIQTKRMHINNLDSEAFSVTPGDYIRISVTDTGCGIDDAILPKIFNPFFTTKSREKGTGLGLYTAYMIIKNHGGHITAYSKPKNGATFNIYLPISQKVAALQESGDIGKKENEEDVSGGSETILLVEDEADIADIEKEMLESLGYTVLRATSGNETVSDFKTHAEKIDLVILDLMLPDMKGKEIFDAIRSISPDIKILLASGFARNGKASELLAAGCNGFIQKPFNLKQLSSAIRAILGGK